MLIPRGVEGAPRPSSWEGSWQVKGLSDPSVPPAPRPCPEEVWVAWAFQSKPRGFARKAARCLSLSPAYLPSRAHCCLVSLLLEGRTALSFPVAPRSQGCTLSLLSTVRPLGPFCHTGDPHAPKSTPTGLVWGGELGENPRWPHD